MNDVDKYYIKAVRARNGRSWYDDSTEWIPGRVVSVSYADPDKTNKCGCGLHCSKNLLQAVGYQFGCSDYLLVDPREIISVDTDKIRCKSIMPIRYLTMSEINELAGFNLWEINHPLNPLWIEPQQIRYIPLLYQWNSVRASIEESVKASVGIPVRDSVEESIKASVGNSVWNSVWDSVGDSVWNSVWASVGNSVWNSVWDSVGDSVGNSVWSSVWDSVWNSVGAYVGGLFISKITTWKYAEAESLGNNPWEPLQKLWYAGYVPSFDDTTWRLHVGRDARIVCEIKL